MQNQFEQYTGWRVNGYIVEDECLVLYFKDGSLIFNGQNKVRSSQPLPFADKEDEFDNLLCANICHIAKIQQDVYSIEFKINNDQIINLIFKDIYDYGIVFDEEINL